MTSFNIYDHATQKQIDEFQPTFLYIKKHTITGKLYFGKTVGNVSKYNGSGIYWKNHIKKYGHQYIETLWYCYFTDICTLVETALNLSNIMGITKDKNWCNQIEENGLTGGFTMVNNNIELREKAIETRIKNKKTWKRTETSKKNISKEMKGYWDSEEGRKRKKKLRENTYKEFLESFIGPPKPLSVRKLNSEIISCPHCGNLGTYSNMKRWHFDSCKSNPNRISLNDPRPISCLYCKTKGKTSPNFFKLHGSNCKLRP